jgi:hypothetical protein
MTPINGSDGLKRRAGGIEDEYWYERFFIYTSAEDEQGNEIRPVE